VEKTANKELIKFFTELPEGQQILLFDGVCNLCNKFVQFVIRRDAEEKFAFASLQSELGQQLLCHFQLSINLKTVVLIDKDKAYTQSDVPLKVGQALGGWMRIAWLAWLVPKFLRNLVYGFIAANRYRLFGKQEHCMLPRPEWRHRFLDILKTG